MPMEGKWLGQGRPASKQQSRARIQLYLLLKLFPVFLCPWDSTDSTRPSADPTLGASTYTEHSAPPLPLQTKRAVPWALVTGERAVCMWGGVISFQAGPCLLMPSSYEPNGELACQAPNVQSASVPFWDSVSPSVQCWPRCSLAPFLF